MLQEQKSLSLNEQIELFNREVHAFEDTQQQEIVAIWEKINSHYLNTHQLSDLRSERLKNGFAQAFVNLSGMMQAKSLYEADLYRQSYIKALELVKTPRRRFIMLQTRSLELAHDNADVKTKFAAVEQELLNLKSLYSAAEQTIFEDAHRELKEMVQIQDKQLFAQKKKQFMEHLADIHERAHQRTSAEKNCEEDVEAAINHGQAIFDARASYLEDTNHWMSRAKDISEKSWTGIGVGLSAGSLALAVPAIVGGLALAPLGILVTGVVGAAYGAVDLARTMTSTLSEETTVKLGERAIAKPKLTNKEKAKQFAKKALPVALCVLGAAVAVAAIVVTGGIFAIGLAVAGAVLSGTGVAQMAYNKYQEKKEVNELQETHKKINNTFDKKSEELIKQIPTEIARPQYADSLQESMTLLTGHALSASDLKTIKTESAVEEIKEDEGGSGSESENEIEEIKEDEGGAEGETESEDELPPTLRP